MSSIEKVNILLTEDKGQNSQIWWSKSPNLISITRKSLIHTYNHLNCWAQLLIHPPDREKKVIPEQLDSQKFM